MSNKKYSRGVRFRPQYIFFLYCSCSRGWFSKHLIRWTAACQKVNGTGGGPPPVGDNQTHKTIIHVSIIRKPSPKKGRNFTKNCNIVSICNDVSTCNIVRGCPHITSAAGGGEGVSQMLTIADEGGRGGVSQMLTIADKGG